MARKVRIDLSLDNTHSLSDFPISIYSGTTSGTTTELVYANITSGPVEFEVEDSDLNIVNGEHPFLFVRFSSDGCHDEIVKVPVPRVDCEMCVSFVPYGQPPTATPNPTNEPTPNPTASPTPSETPDATPNPTNQPTPNPTNEPTPNPTPNPTAEPTPNPTANPTPEPTPQPTPNPTPEPTENTIVASVRLGTPETNEESACANDIKAIANKLYILEGSSIFTLDNGALKINVSTLSNSPGGTSVDFDIYYGDETISTNSLDSDIGTVNGGSPSAYYVVSQSSCVNLLGGQKVLATVSDLNNPSTVTFSLCTPGPTPEPTTNEQTDLLKIIDCDNLPANPGSPYYLIDQSQTCIGNQLSLSTSTISEGDVILYTVGGENCGGEINCAEVQPGTWTGTPSALRYGEDIAPSCGACDIP